MGKTTQEYYSIRLTRVLQFIDSNLELDLSAERLAKVAGLSKFHFHRIFKGAIGETLNAYVVRRRLDRAASLLKNNSSLNATQVALQVGFNSPEHFSRSFKERFGFTARELMSSDSEDPDSLKNSKIYQEVSDQSFYHIYEESRSMPADDFDVEVRDFPATHVAYVTEVFGKDGTNLINAYLHLMDWARESNLFNSESQRFAISRDNVDITPAEQYRLEFCISVPGGMAPTGRIGMAEIHGGQYALIHVVGDIHRVAQAWDFLYKEWLPSSEFVPVDEPAIEHFLKGPEQIGWEQFDLEIGIPVSKQRS